MERDEFDLERILDGIGEPSVPSAPKTDALGGPYSFPSEAARSSFREFARASSDEEISLRLSKLKTFVLAATPDPRDYMHTRAEVCELGLELNRRQSLAPAARDYRKAKPPTVHARDRGLDERWFVADRVVIELDWIRVRGIARDPKGDVKALVGGEVMDFQAASAYACLRRPGDKRGTDVGLPEHERLLLTCFHEKSSRERMRTIEEAVERFRQRLLDLSAHARYQLSDAEALSTVKIAYRSLLVARGSPDLACRIGIHLGGRPVTPQRMRDLKRRIEKLGNLKSDAWGRSVDEKP